MHGQRFGHRDWEEEERERERRDVEQGRQGTVDARTISYDEDRRTNFPNKNPLFHISK